MKGATEGRFMVGEAARMGSTPIATGRPNFSNQILRRPRGTIFCISPFCISPWNFPAMTPLRKMCPAIAFGNAVIFKPSRFTPAANYILCEIAREFFPAGLVQMAMIGGRQASEMIVTRDIQGVSFTGSVSTGRLVGKAATENLIPAQLELGGKNAAFQTGGAAPDRAGDDGGYFYHPTILDNVEHDSTAGRVEIFGPVLSILEYDDFDDALRIMNGTEFGLTSALFSNRNSLVQRFLAESRNGMMHVNHGTVPDNNMPFGGVRSSGVGAYSVGPTAINFYTSEHAAYVAY